jgi:ABC-type sugar transport system substrate-binding protein
MVMVNTRRSNTMSFRPSRRYSITLGRVIASTAVALVTLSPGPASGAPLRHLKGRQSMPRQVQKALEIVMVPKFTGTAYFAATQKGAKEAVAELKEKGVAIDFLYTGPSVANTDEHR